MRTMAFLLKNKSESIRYRFYRKIYALCALLFLFSSSISHAAQITLEPQNTLSKKSISGYMAYGQGRQTCGAYLQALQMADSKNFLQLNYFRQWMAGYMSSYNLFYLNGNGAIAGKGDEIMIEKQLANYCQNNSDKVFASAAATVILNLKTNR